MADKKYLWIILIIFCLFSIRAMAGEAKGENKMRIAKITGENNPFGVLEFLHWNDAWNSYKYPDKKSLKKAIGLMKEAGIGWVRMDFLWNEIEPEKGEFEFKKYDIIVDLLVKNGIKILGILDYSADWASSCGQWNCPPADNKVFVNYAVRVAGHYKDKVLYWEIWNEPDSRIYWLKQDGLKSYCLLLKEVYIALKEAVPECKVLNGGLASGISSVNNLYDNRAGGYFDILNLHVFESPLNPGAVKAAGAYPKAAYKIMARNGDAQKKIWVTEIGCPGVKKNLAVKNWWLGENPSERRQAEWVKEVYAELLENPVVERVFWAFLRDTQDHWGNGVDYFGLIRWDFSKKPAFVSYQKSFNNWKKSR